MFKQFQQSLLGIAVVCTLASGAVRAEENVLHIYNWSDYIAEDTVANFEKETGIKVVYDVFDSNEVLEAKLMTGKTGFDIVVPSAAPYLGRQIQAGVYQPLDKSKLTNYKNLDPVLLKGLEAVDPENKYAIPYLWGTTGIGYNPEKVKAALGENAPVDSWDLVLKPENLEKLSKCGVYMLDTPTEIFPIILNYLGKNPLSEVETDYTDIVKPFMLKLRPFITNFHSSEYINALANGDICVAIGWSGDVLQAADRAKEANKGVTVAYSVPKEGTIMWFDMIAIPKDAKNVAAAYKFIDFVLRPEVIASVTNFVHYANPNPASLETVIDEVKNNKGVYPADEVKKKLFMLKILPQKVERVLTRVWTTVKTGK
ncbi:extracellular solute-binding protein [Beggiatoa leptomitoformis]|uniref:Putrescine-binding periplasmic protein n=1 Tax=Beggiatoa leptomitoformis TaxID=288004 RepID=A0A2N9YCG6_9GAMM|nr:extracellular solute-binding protein [Beggiatoa leptomitoformis]ALG66548.1 extracellular solute-binding protein [Beggiatoa leptomitoformis]AUI68153.1 extracellular solute-binding protein [Beggiatoa leptomitoformis]